MRKKDVERYLEDHLDRFYHLYHLGDWDIDVSLSGESGGETPAATCKPAPQYCQASIVVYYKIINSEDDLEDALSHEFEHVLQSPFWLFLETVLDVVDEDVKQSLNTQFLQCAEASRVMIRRHRDRLIEAAQ